MFKLHPLSPNHIVPLIYLVVRATRAVRVLIVGRGFLVGVSAPIQLSLPLAL